MSIIRTHLKPLLIAQIRTFAAVLAVFFLVTQAIGQEGSASPGIRVAIRLMDDGRVTQVVVDKWDRVGIHGDFGTHSWGALEYLSMKRTFQKFMDRSSGASWLLLGELQLERDDPRGDKESEASFLQALRRDPALESQIDAARGRGSEVDRLREEAARIEAAEQLREGLPAGVTWTARPWPVLDDAQQAQAVIEMREDSQALLEEAGFENAQPVETRYFLVYSALPARETASLVRQLDGMYLKVTELLGIPGGLNLFWGKASIFICRTSEEFRLIEAQAFKNMVTPGVIGLCHQRGPKVFVNTFRAQDDLQFASTLVHETVHGIMHRFISPVRLPTWADEGFAEYVAGRSFRGSPVDSNRRPQGLDFIRSGGDVSSVVDMSYQDGSWPGEQAVGYAVGYLLCTTMIRENPGGFADWVRAVKAGKDWKSALEDEYGVSSDRLVSFVRQWHLTND